MLSILPSVAALMTATAERGAPTGQDSLVEAGDPHFPQPLITDLEAKLDASWEFPNDLRLVGTQELVQLGESMHATATAAAQPQRASPFDAPQPGPRFHPPAPIAVA